MQQFVKKIVFIMLLCVTQFANATTDKPLTVVLDWFVNPNHAPLFVADYFGFFRQQGIHVKLINPADPNDAEKLVAAGKADIGVSYQPSVMMAIDQGLPITHLGTLINSPLDSLTVLASSPVQTIADLRGKRVGYSVAGSNHVSLKTMLASAGLTTEDVTLINVHYGLTQALLAKKVDAVVGMMRNIEPIQLELNGEPARVFYPEDHGMPTYDELIYIVNIKQRDDPRYAAFLIALKQATAYLKANPQRVWQAFSKAYPELNNEFNKRAWSATLHYFSDNPQLVNKVRYAQYSAFLAKNSLIKKPIALNRYNASS